MYVGLHDAFMECTDGTRIPPKTRMGDGATQAAHHPRGNAESGIRHSGKHQWQRFFPTFAQHERTGRAARVQTARGGVSQCAQHGACSLRRSADEGAEEDVGQTVEPAVHADHARIDNAGVGTRHADVLRLHGLRKIVGEDGEGKLAAAVCASLGAMRLTGEAGREVPNFPSDGSGENNVAARHHQGNDEAGKEGCGKTVHLKIKFEAIGSHA